MKYSPAWPPGRRSSRSFSIFNRCTTSGQGISADAAGKIDIDAAKGAKAASRENNLRQGRRAESGSATFRIRTRRAVVSTRTTPDIVFEYSGLFQHPFGTIGKRCDQGRESERRRKVRPQISGTSAGNNLRGRKRLAISSHSGHGRVFRRR